MVTIETVAELAMLYLADVAMGLANGLDGQAVMLNVRLDEAGQVISKNVYIYPSEVYFAGAVTVASLKTLPLSRNTQKTTAKGRTEYLSFYGGGNVMAYVVYKGATADMETTVSLGSSGGSADSFYRMNVSPSVIAGVVGVSESALIYYNVYKDSSSPIRYVVDERNYPEQRNFFFRNCFGAQENITCYGDEVSDRKWTRVFGAINKNQISISRELENRFTVNTGFISAEEVEVFEDLMNSGDVRLMDQYGLQMISVLEESFKLSTRKDELVSVEFTYKYTKTNQFRTSYKPFQKPRVFSVEFDNAFE